MSFGLNFRAHLIPGLISLTFLMLLTGGTSAAQCPKKMAEIPSAPELLGFVWV